MDGGRETGQIRFSQVQPNDSLGTGPDRTEHGLGWDGMGWV